MRVAVIGGGGAGLATTWLLEHHHDVTLYEQQERLGGHAHTIDVEAHGQRLTVDAGFQFFGAGRKYETFNRLLDALQVERTSYAATMSLTRTQRGQSIALPPIRGGRAVWESLTPRAVAELLRFRGFLVGIPSFLERHDTTVTTEEYIGSLTLPASFVDGFLYPFLQALWCVDLPTLRSFAAFNTLHYLADTLTDGFRPPRQLEIAGGIRGYVDALARDLSRAEVRIGAGAVSVEAVGGEYEVQDAEGRRDAFDHVVIATSAEQAAALLTGVRGASALTSQLDRIEYFDTSIAIHGDRRLMPPNEAAWSVVNARWDGRFSQLSVWDAARGLPVFRSWVTFEDEMPEPLYAVATYRHGKVTPAYFDAQRRLNELNGRDRVWIAGLFMGGADSHESAVRSAVTVARALAPGSARLAMLQS